MSEILNAKYPPIDFWERLAKPLSKHEIRERSMSMYGKTDHKYWKFVNAIIGLSESKEWDGDELPPECYAVNEWDITAIDRKDNACICGKEHIKKNIHISNLLNKNTTVIGSTCVKHFLGYDLTLVFSCLDEIKKNPLKATWNMPLAMWVAYRGLIDHDEFPYVMTHCAGSSFDEEVRYHYNKKILEKMNY